jgi:hypothetical protein
MNSNVAKVMTWPLWIFTWEFWGKNGHFNVASMDRYIIDYTKENDDFSQI